MVSTTKERKPWSRPPISMNFQVEAVEQADVSYVSCPTGPALNPLLSQTLQLQPGRQAWADMQADSSHASAASRCLVRRCSSSIHWWFSH